MIERRGEREEEGREGRERRGRGRGGRKERGRKEGREEGRSNMAMSVIWTNHKSWS